MHPLNCCHTDSCYAGFYRANGSGSAAPVLARPVFLKVKIKFHFYKKQVIKCNNTGYFNGAPYNIPGVKILELSWHFCWYWKETTNRPLRLKPRLKHIVSSATPVQVIIDNNKRTC